MTAEKWKAEQRDWLLGRLRELANNWTIVSKYENTYFTVDPDHDRTAKARTGACAIALNELLKELE